MKLNHKAAFWGFNYILAVFGIAFMLIIFYVSVQDDVKDSSKEQAEKLSSDVELHAFFSDLIHQYGIQIASGDAEGIIERYAAKTLPKGGYDADCTTKGTDKECTLTITLHETLSKILEWSMYASPISATWVMVKLAGLDSLTKTTHEAYLPVKPGAAMRFSLTTKVKFA